jgi:hypothetical protein
MLAENKKEYLFVCSLDPKSPFIISPRLYNAGDKHEIPDPDHKQIIPTRVSKQI